MIRLSLAFIEVQDSVLDAGLKEGLELPYACKGGVCSTCRAMLVEGEVDMDANFALEDYELARGYVLTCQSYPTTDRLTVDFDNWENKRYPRKPGDHDGILR